MQRYLAVSFLILLAASASGCAAGSEMAGAAAAMATAQQETYGGPQYHIGPGDQLRIEVLNDPSLTRLVVVLPDGKISFPLIGELLAEGKTVGQLKKEIEEKLSRYVDPLILTVDVKESNSLYIYVLGQVATPGRKILTNYINVLQALALAGGFGPFASPSKIRIFRQEGEKTLVIPFNFDEVTAGKNVETNILLRRGDTVFVP